MPDFSRPWLQSAFSFLLMFSFSTSGAGGLSGSPFTLAKVMEVWAWQEKVSAQYSKEEWGGKSPQ